MKKSWIRMTLVLGGLTLAACEIGEEALLGPCATEVSFEAGDKCANGETEELDEQGDETAWAFESRVSSRS